MTGLGPHPAEVAFQNLMQRQAYSAVRISGAEVSMWNGQFVETTGGPAGVARWDSTIAYDKQVLDRLRHMMYHYGQHHDLQTLAGYREAVRVLLHENSHLLSRAGEQWSESTAPFQQPYVAALEEGVTEAWTQANTSAYIRDLGLERVAPGIGNMPATDAYPQYTPAVRALCQGLGHNMGVPPAEVLRRLNVESARGKWPAVAEMVMQSSGLPQQIRDPAARAAARDQIQQAMQSQFAHLPTLYDPAKPMDSQGFQQMQVASFAAGQAAIQQAHMQVDALRLQHAQQPMPQPGLDRGLYVGRAQVPPQPGYPPGHPPPPSYPPGHPPGQPQGARTLPADMQRTMAVAQSGLAPVAGGRPIGPVPTGDGAKPQVVRTAQDTGREQGD